MERQDILEKISRNKDLSLRLYKQGNKRELNEVKLQIQQDEILLQRINRKTTEFVFNSCNSEQLIDQEIDLHGLTKNEALNIISQRFRIVQDSLDSGNLSPNTSNKDHIYKIIAGAGNHSAFGKAILKPAIQNMLQQKGYDHYADLNHGVFLVRFRKKA